MRHAAVLAGALALAASATSAAADWRRFGYDAARSNVSGRATGIDAGNVGSLVRQQIALPGTVDSSPIYLRDVPVGGSRHDVFVVTTTYGRTLAIDAADGSLLWRYDPPGIERWEKTNQITTASPVADGEKRFVYAASPDGRIHKLEVDGGAEVSGAGWPAIITRNPLREKLGTALNLWGGLVLATTGGYVGDYPPYQGHVVAVDRSDGHLVHVFNALCSGRRTLLDPRSCPSSGAAIWGRAGAVVEPSGRLLVATGNAPWNGRTDWGDSVLELSPDAGRLLQAYTPRNEAALEDADLDLGSTSPAILTPHLVLQGGKDGVLRLLSLDRLNGRGGARALKGGELQSLPTPRGAAMLTAPAVWAQRSGVRIFVADYSATAAYRLVQGPRPRLRMLWENRRGGSSPIVADGLLYVYNPLHGGLNVYRPESGRPIATLPAGPGHWNSPVVADRRIALPEGDANDHAAAGVLDIYRLPPTAAASPRWLSKVTRWTLRLLSATLGARSPRRRASTS